MDFFAKVFLTNYVGGPVINETGIDGKFDFSLDWTPDDHGQRKSEEQREDKNPPDPLGPSLFAALRQQLGLKLEAGKGPVEVLVVDHAEKASAN